MATPLIMTRALGKRFGAKIAVHPVDLSLESGRIYGILGPSGAGKSTLLSLLAAIESPSEGELFLDGYAFFHLHKWKQRKLRQQMGIVFQNYSLFSSRTVLENVTLPLEIQREGADAKKRAMAVLEEVGMAERAESYPAFLSGGERQRVAIARALVFSPKLLFCDEATSALDPERKEGILELLCQLQVARQMTVLFVTHQVEIVSFCSDLMIMEGGAVVEQGRTCDLLRFSTHPTTRRLLKKRSVHAL